MSEEGVEQITTEPTAKIKVKDPKKVAAGKKLAEYHKKAKEALKKQKEEEAMEKQQEEEEEVKTMKSTDWIPNLSFQTVLALVGIGMTAFDLFTRYRSNIADLHVPAHSPPTINHQTNEAPRRTNLKGEWM